MFRTSAAWKQAYLDQAAFYEHDGTPNAAHPILTSGLHSDVFFNSRPLLALDRLLREAASDLVTLMAQGGVRLIGTNRIVGPQTGATKLSEYMGDVITERTGHYCGWASPAKREVGGVKSMVFDNPEHIVLPGEEVIPCDDVLTTGGSVKLTQAAIEERGARVLPYLCVLVNRTGATEVAGKRVFALINRHANSWPAETCPLCKMDSRAIHKPKDNWAALTRRH